MNEQLVRPLQLKLDAEAALTRLEKLVSTPIRVKHEFHVEAASGFAAGLTGGLVLAVCLTLLFRWAVGR